MTDPARPRSCQSQDHARPPVSDARALWTGVLLPSGTVELELAGGTNLTVVALNRAGQTNDVLVSPGQPLFSCGVAEWRDTYCDSNLHVRAWAVGSSPGQATLTHRYGGSGGGVDVACEAALTLEVSPVCVDRIDVTSAKLGESPNPPPFQGETEHVFRPDRSPQADKHAVVLYKDVADESFSVLDFDVALTATLAPSNAPTDQLTFHWEKVSGPASGELLPSGSLSATYRNPKTGGVYRFRLTVRKDGDAVASGEANLVLPLAGAEMDGAMQSDLAKADAFATAAKAKYSSRWQLQNPKNWRRWFWNEHAGDYTGRPGNDDSPTVWYYNQVNDDSGFGAVCTWKGRPVRLTKPSNFIIGYAMQQIGTSRSKALAGTLSLRNISGWNFTDSASVGAGWDVANGGNYGTTVSTLVDYIWTHEAENDKSRKVWPNPGDPDNYRGSSTDDLFDFNTGYGAPGFLFMTQ